MRNINCLFLCLSYTIIFVVESLRFVKHPDQGLAMPDIIRKHGYSVDVHTVITEDGYITTAYRIPSSKRSSISGGDPVLFLHGFCGCSDNYINSGPNSSTAYFLAEKGYDIWLMNSRGNRHARLHKNKNPDKDKSFWGFGWHEVGVYDLPAFIDYILKVTNKTELYFIGHSSGTTSYLALMSEKPDYNEKINVAVLMAPSAFLTNIVEPINPVIDVMLPVVFSGVTEILPYRLNNLLNEFFSILCSEVTIMAKICAILLNIGISSSQIDMLSPQHIMQTSPGGCTAQGMLHYAQLWISENFTKYDYGKVKNLEVYNSSSPPVYNLRNSKRPVALFYARADAVVPAEGVLELAKRLPNLENLYEVPVKEYGHTDFIFGKNNHHLVNEPILKIFQKYSKMDV